MYKDYALERVCVIDFLPCATRALKETLLTVKRLGLNADIWSKHYRDVQRLFFHHCFEQLQKEYDGCNSKFQKVFAVYPILKTDNASVFINKHFSSTIKTYPFPHCVVRSLHTPDLSTAASGSLNKKLTSNFKLKAFTKTNKLTQLSSYLQKKHIHANIKVDFSE